MVVLREILLSYDAATTEAEKDSSLSRLKDYCSWSHDYTKPTNLKKIKKGNAEESKLGAEGDTSEEEDEELRKFSSCFKSEDEFNRNILVDSFITSNNAASIHPVSEIHKSKKYII